MTSANDQADSAATGNCPEQDYCNDRLIRLEENAAFLERQCEGLHNALLAQQRQMDQLEKQVAKQAAKIVELQDLLAGGVASGSGYNLTSGSGTPGGSGGLSSSDGSGLKAGGYEKPPHY